MKRTLYTLIVLGMLSPAILQAAIISETIVFDATIDSAKYDIGLSDFSGLGAEATFILDTDDPDVLTIRLTNTSTALPIVYNLDQTPGSFDVADQLLTSISFDFDGIALINGGNVKIGDNSYSMNFGNITSQLSEGDDVSGEWGYSNINPASTGMLPILVTSTGGNQYVFGGTNLDGPANLNGPQAGLASDPILLVTDKGYILDTVVITLDLNAPLANLDFLDNDVRVEFGSDAAFLPEPATLILLGSGFLVMRRRKK